VNRRSIELVGSLADQVHELRDANPGRTIMFRAPGVPVRVEANPFRLEEVVSNLVSNAIKYSPPDQPVDISVSTSGGQAVVSVMDRGDGIPKAEQARVFEPFHKVRNGGDPEPEATGLGLYIAKKLVEAMSGHLWVESAPGTGSTFSFTLPLGDNGPAPPVVEQRTDGLVRVWVPSAAAAPSGSLPGGPGVHRAGA
jgi:two-component system sensor histidine kinase VicK